MAINILDEMKNDFLVYAGEVNTNRSLPDVRDGLKPSQRACLWEMYDKGYSSNKPHVKSAKVDGGVIANWHPHGSEYNTFGRMSQEWINNICEVDWHGANGSQLGGDQLAASRYTECRLSPAAEEGFFSNIKKNTVDFIPNFSEDLEWPSVLPAIFPRLFVNGSQGIGYTIAQEWEPGNLKEFTNKVKTYIEKGVITCDDIYPDYPSGGIIINKKDIHNIYETGKGSIILRGKAFIEDNIIKITELPYQVYAEPLIANIKDLVNAGTITGIEDICNKSDDDGLLIEIECRGDKLDTGIILNKLYKLTNLQISLSANQMALLDGVPTMFTLTSYIKTFIDHNIACIKREYQFDLDKAIARKEIVEGLISAISIIDQVISTIRKAKSSETAKQDLIAQYKFTENQAKAIIDMRLGKLANLEIAELNKEEGELLNTIDKCDKLLASTKLQNKEFISRLEYFTNKYGQDRKTEVVDIDIVKEKAIAKASKPSNEQCMVCLTKGNYIKRVSLVNYKPQTKVTNEQDKITHAIKVGVKDKVIFISEKGLMYKLQANKIPNGTVASSGTNLTTLFNDKIIAIYSGSEEGKYLFFLTKLGLAKKMESNIVFSIGKNIGTNIVKLDPNDILIGCYNLNAGSVSCIVSDKRIEINTDKFKTKGKSAGCIRAIKLKEGQLVNGID